MKAFKVKAIDTTAAGDAFLGGLAFGLSENKPIREVLKIANALEPLQPRNWVLSPPSPLGESSNPFLKVIRRVGNVS